MGVRGPLGNNYPWEKLQGKNILIVGGGFAFTTLRSSIIFLLDPANHELHQREWRGRMRTYYAMPYEGHYIWGATAGMIRNFHERMQAG